VDGDIGDSATAQKITETAIARFGRIDVLVNNAGLLLAKPFINYTSGDFEALVSTILAGFFYISQNAAKQMLRQECGHVVNISTSVADQPIAGVPCALQVLTKGGLQERPPELDTFAAAFAVAGEDQEKAADEATAVLLKRFSGNPDVQKRGRNSSARKKSKRDSIRSSMGSTSVVSRRPLLPF
jgi:hypothetical protein